MICYDYLYNKEYYGSMPGRDHFSKAELSWREIASATVFPAAGISDDLTGGLLDEQGKFVDGSGIHRGKGDDWDLRSEVFTESDEDIVFLGVWPNVWGHCITDNIRRLWVLRSEGFMNKYGHLRFLYIPFLNQGPGDSFCELLDMIGVSDIRLEALGQTTRFRNVILPDECFWREPDGTRMFTAEYRDLIDSIRDCDSVALTQAGSKKIYFSYRKHPAMRVIGERKLEEFFSELEYEIIYPEKYTFREQLGMLLGCEEFACTVGSASHNSVFLRDGSKVFLIPRAGFISEYQPALNQLHDLDITYVDSSLSLYVKPNRPWEGPFYYIVSDQLRECFGRNGRYKEKKTDFRIYRALAYAMNGYAAPAEYYKNVTGHYLSDDPEWDGRRSLSAKLLRRYRLRQKVTALLG